ncbi:MAG: DUF547 domain-containing protein [Pseudomonadota bacterium]
MAITLRIEAAPSAELWERWDAHDPASSETVDHMPWAQFLFRHVRTNTDGINRVDYANVSTDSRDNLDAYLNQLQQVEITRYSRDEQRAYWLNLYNALTVKVILDNFPVESIKDIKSGFFSPGPWQLELATVEDVAITLDDIEHRILRPIWRDPRIHYGVNCASLGCPNLLENAFSAANTDQLLDDAAQDFVNHSRGADVVGGKLRVSSIYQWFVDDFGGNDAGVIAHLKQHAEPKLAQALENVNSIDQDSYDWALNSLATGIEKSARGGRGGS